MKNEGQTINVAACVGDWLINVDLTVPKEKWNWVVKFAADEVLCSIEEEEMLSSEEDEKVDDISYHLQMRAVSMTSILNLCNMLQQLLDRMLDVLIASKNTECKEFAMLKGIKDVKVAMCGYNDDDEDKSDEQIVFIEDADYPEILLDEIEAMLKQRQQQISHKPL